MGEVFRSHITAKLARLTNQDPQFIRPVIDRSRFTKGAKITVALSSVFAPNTNRRHQRFQPSFGRGLSEDAIEEAAEEDESSRRGTRPADPEPEGDMKADLYRRCEDLAERWEHDEFVDKVDVEGRCINLHLNRERLFRETILQVAREGDQFGRTEFAVSLQSFEFDAERAEQNLLFNLTPDVENIIVEYELPGFGHRFEPSHMRGIHIAGFAVRTLRLGKAKVETRVRLRLWSFDTGLALAEFERTGNNEELRRDPLRYLTGVLIRANARIEGNEDSEVEGGEKSEDWFDIEGRALSILAELSRDDQKSGPVYDLFLTVFSAWKDGMNRVLERYGLSSELAVISDELDDGLFYNRESPTSLQTLVVNPLSKGHAEAPLLKPRVRGKRKSVRARSQISLAGNGEESDPDSIYDDDGEDDDEDRTKLEWVDPVDGLALDLRLGSSFGVAALTHSKGAPTPLAVDVVSALRRGGIGQNAVKAKTLTYVVTPWSKQYRLLLARRVLELLNYWNSPSLLFSRPSESVGTFWMEIPFGRVLALETDHTLPSDDNFSSPTRWIDLATAHLRTISGKSSMVFPDEDEDWDPQAGEAHYTKVEGRDGVSDEVAVFLANSAIALQIYQAKRVKDCTFDWTRIMEDRKDTGLYLQYAHARLCGIQRRSGVPIPEASSVTDGLDLSLLARTPHAIDLVSVMVQLPSALTAAAKNMDVSAYVPHLVSLARQISSGHNSMFVKGAQEDIARARMALLWAARVAIAGGLKMLGLTPMEKM
ncbi:Arginyl-tRNA synthetase [Phlyctochytrium planicorne]|nr:Arginyl-tRNA synthetase [Phlyctochytrium planicorne]